MDKVELGLAIASVALGAFISAKQPQKSVSQFDGFVDVGQNVAVKVLRKADNVREAKIKYIDGNQTLYSNEHIDCKNPRHKIISLDLYLNGVYQQTQHIDFPRWEANNKVENMIMNVACNM